MQPHSQVRTPQVPQIPPTSLEKLLAEDVSEKHRITLEVETDVAGTRKRQATNVRACLWRDLNTTHEYFAMHTFKFSTAHVFKLHLRLGAPVALRNSTSGVTPKDIFDLLGGQAHYQHCALDALRSTSMSDLKHSEGRVNWSSDLTHSFCCRLL